MKLTQQQQAILTGEICFYCNYKTERILSQDLYGYDIKFLNDIIIICKPCNAYVGTHRNSQKSLGRVANSTLRKKRNQAHAIFDRLYRDNHLSRNEAYQWLSISLNIPREYTHIAMFGEQTCDRVIELSTVYLKQLTTTI